MSSRRDRDTGRELPARPAAPASDAGRATGSSPGQDSLRTTRRRPGGLTARGLTFLACGTVICAVGVLRGWPPLAQIGALLLGLPLATLALTAMGQGTITAERRPAVAAGESGQAIGVHILVRAKARTAACVLQDPAPAALGGSHWFALPRMSAGGVVRPHYRIVLGVRGIHRFEPLLAHTTDSLGLVRRVRQVGHAGDLLVTPAVHDLSPRVLNMAAASAGEGRVAGGGRGQDDLTPRPYQPGDEVRRVNWGATARTGTLMVRSEETPERNALRIIVDVGRDSHHGFEPRSSLDCALSVVASVGCLALSGSWDLQVRTTAGRALFDGHSAQPATARMQLLYALARLAPGASSAAPPGAPLADSEQGHIPILLVVGGLDEADMRVLARVGGRSKWRTAIVLRTDQWAQPGRRSDLASPTHTSGPGDQAQERAAVLRASGWRVALIGPADDMAAAWRELE